MRMVMLAVVMVAGCSAADTVAVQQVQLIDPVPNAPQTDYQRYKVAREAALTGKAAIPRTIPVALPAKAPTAAEIAPALRAVVTAPRPVVVTKATGPWPRQPVSAAAHARACGVFGAAGAAQAAFLRAGGPQADPGALDPDGDGYACTWRPDAGL